MTHDFHAFPHPDPDTERPDPDKEHDPLHPHQYVMPPRCAEMIETYRCAGEETDVLGSYTGHCDPPAPGNTAPVFPFPYTPNPLADVPGDRSSLPVQDADDL